MIEPMPIQACPAALVLVALLVLCAPLVRGRSELSLDLLADASARLSIWVWATKPPATTNADLPQPELISLDSAPLLEPTDLSAITSVIERKPRPIERIDGVFLDSIDPVSATQGWGTLQRNKSVWEKPITVRRQRFARGLGTHSPSRIVYDLGGKYGRFQARTRRPRRRSRFPLSWTGRRSGSRA